MTKARFRTIVIGSLLLLLAAATIILFFNQTLPPELDAWSGARLDEAISVAEWLGIGIAVIAVTANIGLLFFARWSRPVFAFFVGAATVVTLFTGPVVSTALEAFIYEVTLLLDGFVVALTYFSDARVHFERAT